MTQLTLDTDLTQYQREMLSMVKNLAISLLTIIDDILDLFKIEARRMEIEEIPYTLRGTVFNALKTMAVKANEKCLDLNFTIDSSIPDYVLGDSFRLKQVILNLVGNAIKFTDHGKISLAVKEGTTQVQVEPGQYAMEFIIEDTGAGIAKDKLDLIFNTFQQADGSITRKFGGTGLGLTISKRLAILMGGDIWVNSEAGKGSRFYFTCKVKLATDGTEVLTKQLQPYKGYKVLVVGTCETSSNGDVRATLEDLGLRPVLVSSTKASVVNQLADGPDTTYNAIIVDCLETARILRGVNEWVYLPIVLLAPVVHVSLKMCLDLGITSCMTSPCKPGDLGISMIPAFQNRDVPPLLEETRTLNILLAEDNMVSQRLAVKMLEKYNHTVTVVGNGLEAVEIVKMRRFDVILMDIQMPIMVMTVHYVLGYRQKLTLF